MLDMVVLCQLMLETLWNSNTRWALNIMAICLLHVRMFTFTIQYVCWLVLLCTYIQYYNEYICMSSLTLNDYSFRYTTVLDIPKCTLLCACACKLRMYFHRVLVCCSWRKQNVLHMRNMVHTKYQSFQVLLCGCYIVNVWIGILSAILCILC